MDLRGFNFSIILQQKKTENLIFSARNHNYLSEVTNIKNLCSSLKIFAVKIFLYKKSRKVSKFSVTNPRTCKATLKTALKCFFVNIKLNVPVISLTTSKWLLASTGNPFTLRIRSPWRTPTRHAAPPAVQYYHIFLFLPRKNSRFAGKDKGVKDKQTTCMNVHT